MCIGKLPQPELHIDDHNTHRLCLDTTETGHGIFDLQINKTDMYHFERLFKAAKEADV
jgi:hypothetical protein